MSYKDRKIQRKYQNKWRAKRREIEKLKAFAILGGVCVQCGISDNRVLHIDHIIPILRGSNKGDAGTRLKQRLANGSLKPDGLQLLCANCHQIKCHSEYGLYVRGK